MQRFVQKRRYNNTRAYYSVCAIKHACSISAPSSVIQSVHHQAQFNLCTTRLESLLQANRAELKKAATAEALTWELQQKVKKLEDDASQASQTQMSEMKSEIAQLRGVLVNIAPAINQSPAPSTPARHVEEFCRPSSPIAGFSRPPTPPVRAKSPGGQVKCLLLSVAVDQACYAARIWLEAAAARQESRGSSCRVSG